MKAIKTNKLKSTARKGSLRKTIILLSNNGVATDANEKVTKTKIIFNNKRYEDTKFDRLLNKFYPINNYDTRKEQLKAYKHDRFVVKNPVIIQAFK